MGDPVLDRREADDGARPGRRLRPDGRDAALRVDDAQGVEVLDTNIDYGASRRCPTRGCVRSPRRSADGISIDDLHVDHRKIVVIDGRIAYCGGANVGAQYLFTCRSIPAKDAREEGEERRRPGRSAEPGGSGTTA